MQFEIWAAGFGCLLLLAGFVVLIRSVARESRHEEDAAGRAGAAPVNSVDQSDVSADRYRPVVRLLDPQDLAFLEQLPGYHPSIGRRLRNERRKLMLTYLSMMKTDFDASYRLATDMLANAPQDQGSFAEILLRERSRFLLNYWRIRVSLVLRLTGETPAVARQMLASMQSVEQCLQTVSPRLG